MRALQQLGEFEWASRRPRLEAKDGDLSYPPIIVWRYKNRSSEIAAFLSSAVSSFDASIEWSLRLDQKNWSLMPRKIQEYAEQESIGELKAAEHLKALIPELGMKANQELERLADHIESQFRNRSAVQPPPDSVGNTSHNQK